MGRGIDPAAQADKWGTSSQLSDLKLQQQSAGAKAPAINERPRKAVAPRTRH